MPPVQRPLFLDQDERRIGEEGRIGSSGFQVHERNLEMDRENQELKRNIERVLRENQLLRERVDALEFQKRKRLNVLRLRMALMASWKDPTKRMR